MDLERAPSPRAAMQMDLLDDLTPISVKVLGKRKTPDATPAPTPTVVAEPPPPAPVTSEERTEKKANVTQMDRGWSFFTESETKHLVDMMQPLMATSPRSGISVKLASTHFVLHLSNLVAAIPLQLLENALRQLNVKYEVRGATVDLERQFIDIRFRVPVATTRTANLTNVINVAQRELTASARAALPKDARRDTADWLLASTLITHAENVLGDRSPYDLDVQIDAPDGDILTHTGVLEGKAPRANYRMRITGYAQLDLCHLRSFAYLFPFHVHPPTIQFDTHSLHVEFEKHSRPICGQVTEIYDDETELFSAGRNGAKIALSGTT